MVILQLFINGIITGSLFSLFAISFSIIYGSTKIFHFAHGMIFTCGAYLTFLFHILLGMNILASIFLSIVLSSLLGVAINYLLYEPLQNRKASPLVILVASMGTYISLNSILSLFFSSNVQIISGGAASTFKIGYAFITPMQITIITITIILNSLLALFFMKTRAGLAIRAIGEDSELAEIFGMSPRKIKFLVFAIGSALASISAILLGLDIGTINPNLGLEALLVCFVALVVGGMENIPGAAAGGFIIGMISNFGIWRIEARWQQTIVYSIVIFVLLLKPKGIFTSKKDKF